MTDGGNRALVLTFHRKWQFFYGFSVFCVFLQLNSIGLFLSNDMSNTIKTKIVTCVCHMNESYSVRTCTFPAVSDARLGNKVSLFCEWVLSVDDDMFVFV